MRVRMMAGVLWLAALTACASRWGPLDLDTLPGRETWPEAEAAILESRRVVRFHSGPDGAPAARVESTNRFRILGPQGRGLVPRAQWFQTGKEEVLRFDVRLVMPDGKIRERTLKDAIERASYEAFVLYADHRRLDLDLGPAPLGSVLEERSVSVKREVTARAFGLTLGSRYPTVHESLEVEVPTGWEVAWSAEEAGSPVDWPPRREVTPGGTRYLWEARDLPPLPDEPSAPPLSALARRVDVRLARWTENGVEKTGLTDAAAFSAKEWPGFRDAAVAGPALREKVAELLAEAPADPVARARILFEWVRDRIPYCAVIIGDGGWRPHAADQVLDVRYGDCKDKATLLHTMLGVAGISSRPVLVYSHRGYPRPFRFARLRSNFNHAIVEIDLPGGPLVVDPTATQTAFGRLPASAQGADILQLAAEGARVVRLPIAEPETNRRALEVKARVDRDGSADASFELLADGTRADSLRAMIFRYTGKDRVDALQRRLELRRAEVSEARFEDTRPDPDRPVRALGRLRLRRVLEGSGTTRMLRPAALLSPVVPILPPRRRQRPLVRPLPGRLTVAVELTLPDGAQVVSVPPPVDLEGPTGRYRLTWSRPADDRLRLERELIRRSHILPAEEVDTARAFFEAALAAESRPLVLELP